MTYLLALASALLYGAGDFTGGLATRRASTLPVIVVSQLSGLVLLALLFPFLPAASPSRADLWWGVTAGLTGGAGVALLYRALAIGRMAVVAPTTAVCAVAVPVLVSVALGERPGAMAAAGIVLGLAAIVLVSQQTAPEPAAGSAGGRLPPGVGIALVSGVAVGLFLLSLAQTRPEAGMWPILASRTTSVVLFGLAALFTRRSVRLPGVLGLTLLCGVIDMTANALYLVAARVGPLSVVVTLASLYPASTVLLARVVLGERLNLRQVAGVACALAAIALIVSGER
ncbi:MAG TPA: EamA family transporter [Gemmatimonadales bacterium]|nr:EamA family transporter [Gemmatimonadales bacterium]